MTLAAVTLEILDPVLDGSSAAHGLIRRLASHLHADREIDLDLTRVECVSPEYAQAAFGPLTAAFGKDRVLASLRITGAEDHMIRVIAEAICRGAAESGTKKSADANFGKS